MRKKGSVMVITLMVLLAIMLSFAVVGLTSIVRERQGLIEQYRQKRAENAAHACADSAIDRLGRNSEYAGDEVMNVGGDSCEIRPIINGGSDWTIQAESIVDGSTARVEVVLTGRDPVAISSWEKVSSF